MKALMTGLSSLANFENTRQQLQIDNIQLQTDTVQSGGVFQVLRRLVIFRHLRYSTLILPNICDNKCVCVFNNHRKLSSRGEMKLQPGETLKHTLQHTHPPKHSCFLPKLVHPATNSSSQPKKYPSSQKLIHPVKNTLTLPKTHQSNQKIIHRARNSFIFPQKASL